MKLVALGLKIYLKDRWNQLDVGIVILSVIGIVLEELESKIIPINPTIIRVMRVLRIARGECSAATLLPPHSVPSPPHSCSRCPLSVFAQF